MPQTQITKSVIIGNLTTGQNSLSVFDTDFDQLFAALNALTTFSMYVVDAGAANTYQASFGVGIVVSYFDGLGVDVKITNTNTGPSTFNLNALGSGNILLANGAALVGGELVAGTVVRLVRFGSNWFLSGGVVSGGAVVNAQQSFRQVSTSGSSIEFKAANSNGVPTWAKEVVISLEGVSTNGSSVLQLQLGSGGSVFQTASYVGAVMDAVNAGTSGSGVYSSGFDMMNVLSAAAVVSGNIFLNLSNPAANTWGVSGSLSRSDGSRTSILGGYVTLAGALDSVRVRPTNGTDVFDLGAISARYKG